MIKTFGEFREALERGSYTDKDGYTVHVAAKKGSENFPHGMRKGYIHITTPQGKHVRGGYWMDHPEKHWPDHKDWDHKFQHDYDNLHKADYYKTPKKHRLEREAHQQGTAYDRLKKQAELRSKDRTKVTKKKAFAFPRRPEE